MKIYYLTTSPLLHSLVSLIHIINLIKVPEYIKLVHLLVNHVFIGVGDVRLVQVLEAHHIRVRPHLLKVRHLRHEWGSQAQVLESHQVQVLEEGMTQHLVHVPLLTQSLLFVSIKQLVIDINM